MSIIWACCQCNGRTVTCNRTKGCSSFALNLVGVLCFVSEDWSLFGVDKRELFTLLRDVGEPEKTEGGGLDICIARTELGVRKGGRLRTLLGVWGEATDENDNGSGSIE